MICYQSSFNHHLINPVLYIYILLYQLVDRLSTILEYSHRLGKFEILFKFQMKFGCCVFYSTYQVVQYF